MDENIKQNLDYLKARVDAQQETIVGMLKVIKELIKKIEDDSK